MILLTVFGLVFSGTATASAVRDGAEDPYPNGPAVSEAPQATKEHYVPDHLPYITKYDDGANHGAEYPEELRPIIQNKGEDILLKVIDGRMVNDSWTFNEMRKAWLAKKDDPNTPASSREALNSGVYNSFFNPSDPTKSKNNLHFWTLTFREDNTTGEVHWNVPYSNAWGAVGYHPKRYSLSLTQPSGECV